MSSTADTDDVIEVSTDGVAVQKTFTADEFPVPAIRFEIESNRDDPITFQLSEDIPESFPMDKVGFHPEYHSDQWTAFQDNHVEFTATVEPGERLETVYGIQIDDESRAAAFLTEPTISERGADDDSATADEVDDEVIGNIVSEDRNQAVKDMISGESDAVPGLDADEADAAESTADSSVDESTDEGADTDADDEPTELDLDLSDVDPDPDPVDDPDEQENEAETPDIDLGFEEEGIQDSEPDDEPQIDVDADDAPVAEADDEDEPTVKLDLGTDTDDTGSDDDASEAEADDEDEPKIELDLEGSAAAVDEDEREPTADADETESVAASTDADGETTGVESGPDPDSEPETTSVTDATRVGEPDVDGSIGARLATEIRDGTIDDDDLEAIRSELDLESSGSDIAKVEHLQSRVEEIAAYTDALETFLEENGTGAQLVEELKTDIDALEDEFASLDDRLEGTESRVDDISDWNEELEDDLHTVDEDVDQLEGTVDQLAADIDDVDEDVETVADDLADVEADVESMSDELEDVRADVTNIQEWRDQLGSMFSD